MNIIENTDLRELCSFGTKFRENPVLDIAKLKGRFGKNVADFIARVSRKFNVPKSAFKGWQVGIVGGFLNKLYSLCNGNDYRLPVLSNIDSKAELARL